MEISHSLPWNEFKSLLLAEFCPRNEIKKLETEFQNLKQVSGNNAEYTTRFYELSILVPRLVTPVSVAIEKYIDGLPSMIRDLVLCSQPENLESAIRLAASLTDNLVNDGKLKRSNIKKGNKSKSKKEPEKPIPKRKKTETSQNFNMNSSPNPTAFHAPQSTTFPTYPQPTYAQPTPPQGGYRGTFPLCANCRFHHPVGYACRLCTTCNRFGHMATTCRVGTPPIYAPIPLNTLYPICDTCGERTHFTINCPSNRLAIIPFNQPPV